MSAPTSPGWYDDPDDATQLRYFDGVIWTRHTTPRSTRSAAPVETSTPGQAPGQAAGPVAEGQQAPQAQGRPPAYGQAGHQPTWQAPNPQFPGTPQPGQWNAPSQQGQPQRPTTADGQPLAGYGQRVGAFVLDFIVTSFIGSVLSLPIQLQLSGDLQGATDDLRNGTGSFSSVLDAAMQATQAHIVPLTLIALGASFVYHVVCVGLWSATPGKLALGLSVRAVDRPGRVGWAVAVRRRLLQTALGLFRLSTALELLYLIGSAADLSWPLRDARRQALHDKVAETVVVEGRQPRR